MSDHAQTPEGEELPRRRFWQGQLGLILVIGGSALAVVVALIWTQRASHLEGQVQQKDQQLGAVTDQKDDLADRLISLCGSADAAVQDKLRSAGVCQKAAEAKAEPSQAPPPTVSFAMVRDAVAGYFATHPVRDGHTPTPEELLPIIAQALRANPPKDGTDGHTPTSEELLVLIEQVYAANPPKDGTDGKDGADGKDGVPCDPAVKPECRGPKGDKGDAGPPPYGWSWKDSAGREQSCTRDNTDDAKPHYRCTAPPPEPPPTSSPPPTTTTTPPPPPTTEPPPVVTVK